MLKSPTELTEPIHLSPAKILLKLCVLVVYDLPPLSVMLCFPDSQNVEFICNVLVVADQLLISRLKEMCEVAIAEKREFFYCCYNGSETKIHFFLDVKVLVFPSLSQHGITCLYFFAVVTFCR